MLRRSCLTIGLLLIFALSAPAQETLQGGVALLEQRQDAIQQGIAGLKSLQGSTGAFGTRYRVASTSLACLALMADGSTFSRGPHAGALQRGLAYVLSKCIPARRGIGVFISDGTDSGRMHSHGYATLFLSQIHGTIPYHHRLYGEVLRNLRGSVGLIISSQTPLGGWGYHFRGEREFGQDEASVTVTVVQALRAAQNVGLNVPGRVIDKALEYLEKSATGDGRFRYSLTMADGDRTSIELTAASVSTLNFSGAYRSPVLQRGLNHLVDEVKQDLDAGRNPARMCSSYYYYGNLYVAYSLYQAGREAPYDKLWEEWYAAASQHLVEEQALQEDGALYWDSQRGFGRAYATACALLILQLPRGYLPINQRK